jgi:hypothetical protein
MWLTLLAIAAAVAVSWMVAPFVLKSSSTPSTH